MKHILTAAAMAALFAAPALAQMPSATGNPYEQQIRALYAEIDNGALPEKVRADLEWQAQAVKADAYRHGVIVQVPPSREATAQR